MPSSLVLGTMLFSFPLTSLAAGLTSEDIINALPAMSEPAMPAPVPMPISIDGRGGGSDASKSMIYPGPYQNGGVHVEVSVTKQVKPDFIGMNAYCELGKTQNRTAARDALQQLFTDIKKAVGSDGRVRKAGPISIYPFYDPSGKSTDSFNGTLNVFIRLTNLKKIQSISDYIEEKGCTLNWDVRLTDPQSQEMSVIEELVTKLNTRKAVFEKLLQKRLSRVVGASLNTWVDGYGSYDPDTNTVDATTSLSVTFDLGGRAVLPVPVPMMK